MHYLYYFLKFAADLQKNTLLWFYFCKTLFCPQDRAIWLVLVFVVWFQGYSWSCRNNWAKHQPSSGHFHSNRDDTLEPGQSHEPPTSISSTAPLSERANEGTRWTQWGLCQCCSVSCSFSGNTEQQTSAVLLLEIWTTLPPSACCWTLVFLFDIHSIYHLPCINNQVKVSCEFKTMILP